MGLKIGFVCNEYFYFNEVRGKINVSKSHGGFGFLTRAKAEFLASKGYEVHVFVPGENFVDNVRETIEINKVLVHTYRTNFDKPSLLGKAIRELKGLQHNEDFQNYLKELKLDILQSEDTPPPDILLSKSIKIPFILIFQDPFDYYDNNLLKDSESDYLRIPNDGHLGYDLKPHNYKFKNSFLINMAHRRDYVKPMRNFLMNNNNNVKIYAEAKFISEKVSGLFSLYEKPEILLNPVRVYYGARKRFDDPTLCWVARWDPQKRPDMVLLIAKKMPDITFIMIGTATRNSKAYQRIENYLKRKAASLKNVKILGFIGEEEKREIIGRSWGLLNTSIREGLPITFLEAMAEGTPIVSYVDPDGYTSTFGVRVDYNVDSFLSGVRKVVDMELYSEIGTRARDFTLKNHEISLVMARHEEIYRKMINSTGEFGA